MKTRSLKSILCGAANPNTPGAGGRTPLHRAAHDGKIDDLRVLLENGGDVRLGDGTEEQPLQMAARKGHLECVKLLIQAGADLNHIPSPKTSEYSESALCSIARKGSKSESLPILLELLKAGADPNVASSAGRFPLHAAANCGNVDMVRALLAAGAKLDVFNHRGSLPLHSSFRGEHGNPAVVELLLQAGADVNAPDKKGTPPIFYIINSFRQSPGLLRALLNAHPNLSVTDPQWKKTPLALARSLDLKEIARLLQDAGAPEPPPEPLHDNATVTVETEDGDIEASIEFENLVRGRGNLSRR